MKISLVALDMDGTLLNTKKEITEKTRKYLMDLSKKEIIIALATGRNEKATESIRKKLGCIRYGILANGAIIKDFKEDKLINNHFLSAKMAKMLIGYAKTNNILADYFYHGCGYVPVGWNEKVKAIGTDEYTCAMLKESRKEIIDFYEQLEKINIGIEKISFRFTNEQLKERESLLEKYGRKESELMVSSSLDNNLEFSAAGVSKGLGLWELCMHLQIPIEQTIAFGDSSNDRELLETAGISVAMGNAEAEIKIIADKITLSNDEDGVIHLLKEVVDEY